MIHTMLPVQHLQPAGARLAEPERRLMLAVLQTVVDDWQGSRYRRGTGAVQDERTRRSALAYVSSTDRNWPYSFENICEAMGFDPAAFRRELHGAAKGDSRAKKTA